MTTNKHPSIVKIDSAVELASALATYIAQQLIDAITKNGEASLVVSGGSTPKPLFEALRVMDLPFVGLYTDGPSAFEGQSSIDRDLRSVPMPFTVVVLGMGGDGHTASLFPGAPGTANAMEETESLVGVVQPESVPQVRITLTKAALMNTDCQLLHITGQDKRSIVDEVLQDPAASGYPIARFLTADNQRLTVYTTH